MFSIYLNKLKNTICNILCKNVNQPIFKTAEELQTMDKLQLEAYGRTIGIELDRRRNKDTLIAQLLEHQAKNV